MDWEPAIQLQQRALRISGCSVLTSINYLHDVLALQKLCNESSPLSLTRDNIQRAFLHLRSSKLDNRSLARMLSGWRNFFECMIESGFISENPCAGLKAPRRSKRLPKSLGVDETKYLLDFESETNDPLLLRDSAIFELMYSSGLRLAELAALNLNSIDFANKTLSAIGKGNKERILPVGQYACAALSNYLPVRAANSGEQALFTSRQGQRLGHRQIQKRLDRWSIRAGSTQHVSPHMLRHCFASHLLQSSGDLLAVQELLGHANLSTTQIYTKLDFQYLAKVYDRAHPRALKDASKNED